MGEIIFPLTKEVASKRAFREGLTYDDVLLVPKKSAVISRKDVDVSTRLSRNINLNIPLVSANMDSVTESAMSIAMAREGGIGIIHRFLTMEQQVKEVLKVKRSESLLIETPQTITPDSTIKEAKQLMEEKGIKGLLVADYNNILVGILTTRDISFETDPYKRVYEVMTTSKDLITAQPGISIEEARKTLHKNRIEKLPIVDSQGYLKGLITARDILKKEEHPQAAKDKKGKLIVGAAIGVKKGFLERASSLLEAGTDIIVVDIAHGHSDLAIDTIKKLRKAFGGIEIMAGNIATAEAAKDLIDADVDSIKIGVGPGSTCITRIITGSGVPQLTAVMDVAKAAADAEIPVIADGGLRTSGDLTKALAAGAATGFSGFLFAGTDETPGITVLRKGRKFKIYRGSASFGSALGRKESGASDDAIDPNDYVPEGVESIVPYKGPVSDVIKQLIGGLKSGISYCGAKSIKEMQEKAEFMRVTDNGVKESGHHDVDAV
ncbi:MAG: IMP dehydrogenase [Candidatus Aenigmarchaeota archaeon]|nr:IMP dehydrogenase [Candidatus Aenigmarchaeota archaeon]